MAIFFKVNVSAVVFCSNKILIQKRSSNEDVFPGLWGIPGGTVEITDINLEDALKREVLEEVDIEIKNIFLVKNNIKAKEAYGMIYLMYIADYKSGEAKSKDGETEEVFWLDIKNIDLYEFTPFTKDLIIESYERKTTNNSF